MKVTRDMYGRAAKCVACHRKWFVPKEEEIPDGTAVIQLSEHEELLRATGVFVRPLSGGSNQAEEALRKENDGSPQGSEGGAELLPENRDVPPGDSSADLASPEKASGSGDIAEGELEEGFSPEQCPGPDSTVPVPIRNKGKTPFDIWGPLQLLCGYQKAFNQLEQRVLADEEHGISSEVLEAYGRSLGKIWDKAQAVLQSAHEGVQRQLAGIEGEIDRLTVALRVGEVDLSQFILNTSALRHSRESLARFDHNLQAWRQTDNPLSAGGEIDVTMETFDADSFNLDLPQPVPLDDSQPLPALYTTELRSVLQERAVAEQRIAEWMYIGESRREKGIPSTTGLLETKAALKRVKAKTAFVRQRMQQLLADCAHDLDSLQKYRREVMERDRKKQLKSGVISQLLSDVERAERNLVRSEAHLRQALHANASAEVPVPTPSMIAQKKQKSLPNLILILIGAYVTAMVFVFPALIILSLRETGELHRIIVLPAIFVLLQPAALLIRDAWARMAAAVFLWIVLCAMLVAALLSFARYAPIHAGRHIVPFLDTPGMLLAAAFFFFGIAVGVLVAACYPIGLKKMVLMVLCCALFSLSIPSLTYAFAQRHTGPQSPKLVLPAEKEPDDAGAVNESSGSDPALSPDREGAVDHTEVPPEVEPAVTAIVQPPEKSLPPERVPVIEGEEPATSDVTLISGVPLVFSLHGVVHGEGISPLFRASVQFPDQTESSLALRLGQVIAGEWRASEYNSDSNKLTITNGEKLLLLSPGDSVTIQAVLTAEPEQEEK